MPMTVGCPGCGTQLVVPSKCVGQVLACPSCHCQFQVTQPAADPSTSGSPASATPPASAMQPHATPGYTAGTPPTAPALIPPHSGRAVWSNSADALLPAPGVRGNGALAPPVAVPRFIAASSAASAVVLASDGKLPELSLAEVQERGKSAATEAKKPRPKALSLAVGLSMVLSVFFGMYDFSTVEPGADSKEDARFKISQFYKRPETEALAPFQLLLREAERAHQRGDEAEAVVKYQQVLRLLRAEGRVKSVTETRQSDEELEKDISTLLRNE